MRIALIAPVEETVPPTLYGGTEWIVYHLAHLLHTYGISVDLYAAGNSSHGDGFTLIPTVEKNLRATPGPDEDLKLRETHKWLSLIETITRLKTENYDLIHNHASWRFLVFSPFLTTPVVTTHHGPLNLPYQNAVFSKYAHFPHVSISNNQRRDLPSLNFVDTIYNGININDYTYANLERKEDYVMFLARMSSEKGAIDAAKAAINAKMKLRVAAKVDQVDRPYFESFKQQLDGQYVEFIGEVGAPEKQGMLQRARALIAPIQWEEPFGLMFTEAMASGTPVIAYARGAAPEIIEDGVNGFLVNQDEKHIRGDWLIKETGVQGLTHAIEMIRSMESSQYQAMCESARKRVEEKFTAEVMVKHYAEVYSQLANK